MPHLTLNHTTIAYSDTGIPDGLAQARTIVSGHGLLFGGWMFRTQIAALRPRYRCVAIDWRGQGESAIEPVHWVGLSTGVHPPPAA